MNTKHWVSILGGLLLGVQALGAQAADPQAAPPAEKAGSNRQENLATTESTPPAPMALSSQERALLDKKHYQIESLFDGNIFAHGGFGGAGVKATVVDGKTACMVGGSGAWIVNHSFLIGGGGYGLAGPRIQRTFSGEEKTLDFGYGGVILGWICQSEKVLHCSIQTLVGAGGIGYHQNVIMGKDNHGMDIIEDQGTYDSFFVLEPMVFAELNITDWFRISLGGGYRYTAGAQIADITDRDLSGANAELAFKFGYF